VEFAVDDAAAAELGAYLGTLGFRVAGQHRSKAVTLHRNGDVNLVLNAEPDSAASERFEQHGPCVCAMGFRVDDPERALARAEAMLSPTFRERTGEGERRIPAVRAPDGTLIYLVEATDTATRRIWEDDFHLEESAPAEPRGRFGGVDHVAQALTADMMDSFSLFYRAVFGLEPDAQWELPDPYGLVRSRAFEGGGGSVRLPLNTSESGRTGTGRFVSAFAGAGVHHIAFCTADAAAATEAAAERGRRCSTSRATTTKTSARAWASKTKRWKTCDATTCCSTAAPPAAHSATPTPSRSRTASSWRSRSAPAATTASARPTPARAWRPSNARSAGSARPRPH
jgi:4-hydroxyphenylpyruvate dioxygenase